MEFLAVEGAPLADWKERRSELVSMPEIVARAVVGVLAKATALKIVGVDHLMYKRGENIQFSCAKESFKEREGNT